MAELLKISRQLISIANDLRYKLHTVNFDSGELYDFDQTWASTALGFDGFGGSAITTERTYVFIPDYYSCPDKYVNQALVYFGGQFAYVVPVCDRLFTDIKNHEVASVSESVRYSK